jgi:hypothetical protein
MEALRKKPWVELRNKRYTGSLIRTIEEIHTINFKDVF